MRHLIVFFLIIALAGSTTATDLGNTQLETKTATHVGQNPGTPDGREGGEDMASAIAITSIPFADTGNTSDNIDDYDYVCPYGSQSPDVVYRYIPTTDIILTVDLCGSEYDTKTYILDGAFHGIACNDDAYFDDVCGQYVSLIEEAYLEGGMEYFIFVDGYGADSGDYILDITEFTIPPPCNLTCEGLPEGEPSPGPGYEDAFNGGCNSPQFGEPWGDLTTAADESGTLTFCGIAGWTDTGRDTDWYYLAIGETGTAEVTVDAEQTTNVYTLIGDCAAGISVGQDMTVGVCTPGTMVIQGDPGSIFMMWFGSSDYTPPTGFSGYEYNYVANFIGLPSGIVATEPISFDSIKSLYR